MAGNDSSKTRPSTSATQRLGQRVLFSDKLGGNAPFSFGRSGSVATIAIELEPRFGNLRISPINSRNKVGRSHIEMPYDLEHLSALRAAVDNLITELLVEDDTQCRDRSLIELIELLVKWDWLEGYKILDTLVYRFVGSDERAEISHNGEGLASRIKALRKAGGINSLIAALAETLGMSVEEFEQLVADVPKGTEAILSRLRKNSDSL